MKVSNKNARPFVNNLEPFEGSNTFAEFNGIDNIYIVYSYGYHFPLYLNLNGTWYGNKDKYSVSTSKHQSQLKPNGEITWLSTAELKKLINNN